MDPAGQVIEHPWITSGTLQRVLENAQELDIVSVNTCKYLLACFHCNRTPIRDGISLMRSMSQAVAGVKKMFRSCIW